MIHCNLYRSLQGRITTQGDPCNLYREGVCSVPNVGIKLLWLALVTSQKYLTMLINVPCEAEKVSSYVLSMSIGINYIFFLLYSNTGIPRFTLFMWEQK